MASLLFDDLAIADAPGLRERMASVPAPVAQWRQRSWPLLTADLAAGLALPTLLLPSGWAVGSGLLPGLALALVWVALLAAGRTYERRPVAFALDDVRGVVRAGFALGTAMLLVSAWSGASAPASALATTVVGLTALGVVVRLAAAAGRALARRERPSMPVVVAGHRRDVARVVRELRHARDHDFRVVATCLPDDADPIDVALPVCRGFGNLPSAVERHGADGVIVLPCRHFGPAELRRLGWHLESTRTRLFVGSSLLDVAAQRADVGHVGGLRLLHVRHPHLAGCRRWVKNSWERAAAAALVVVLAPVLLVIALMIRTESSGGALFRQRRVGKDGRPFTMLKFRTMTSDAEARRPELVGAPGAPVDDTVLFKLRDDPRVTRLGRRLRRTSLDELPQLLNVVAGQMALVGPRPPLPQEVALYDPDARRRLVVKPGLTGLWQVSGRSDLPWEESVRLDLRYVDNWSFVLDGLILVRTVAAVLGRRGAY